MSKQIEHPARTYALRLALSASALLVVAGLAAFWYAAGAAKKAPAKIVDNLVTVTIRDKVCTPNAISVPAGRTTFTIVNQSDRALEWEILDGVMVVEERENIAPGYSQNMTVMLHPGEYAITCGLLSNPRGTLRVTPSAASDAAAARPAPLQFVGALAEYRVFLALEADTLEDSARQLAVAIDAGNLAQAQVEYVHAHRAYQHMSPVVALFADLDHRLNARAALFEKRAADPAFRGFHRIDEGLFVARSTRGLAPVAEQLLADIRALASRLQALNIPAQRLAPGAASALTRNTAFLAMLNVGAGAGAGVSASSNAAAATDSSDATMLWDLDATLQGAQKISSLLAPLLVKASPALQREIDLRFSDVEKTMAPYRSEVPDRHPVLDPAGRIRITAAMQALTASIERTNAALGLE